MNIRTLAARTRRHTIAALAAIAALSACSERPAPQPETSSTQSAREIAPDQDESGDIVTAEAVAGGVATTYRAYFKDGQLQYILETRQPDASAKYVFYGARLTQYTGAALGSEHNFDVKFDMQGAPLASGTANPDADELAAIRNRAQLLRSLALARRSAQMHTTH